MVDFRAANLKIYNQHSSKRRSICKDHTVALPLGLETGIINIKLTYFLCCWAFSFAQLSLIINGKTLCLESFHPEILQLLTSKKTHCYPAI